MRSLIYIVFLLMLSCAANRQSRLEPIELGDQEYDSIELPNSYFYNIYISSLEGMCVGDSTIVPLIINSKKEVDISKLDRVSRELRVLSSEVSETKLGFRYRINLSFKILTFKYDYFKVHLPIDDKEVILSFIKAPVYVSHKELEYTRKQKDYVIQSMEIKIDQFCADSLFVYFPKGFDAGSVMNHDTTYVRLYDWMHTSFSRINVRDYPKGSFLVKLGGYSQPMYYQIIIN